MAVAFSASEAGLAALTFDLAFVVAIQVGRVGLEFEAQVVVGAGRADPFAEAVIEA